MDDIRYPKAPAEGKTDTSREAAQKVAPRAITLRQKVLAILQRHEMTNSELSDALQHSMAGLQPRTSELKAMKLIEDSGKRRKNRWGNNEIVWRAL